MNKAIGCLAVTSCFVLGTTLAYADGEKCDTPTYSSQHYGKMDEMTFRKLDTSGNGAISKKEFNAFNAKHFKGLDANKDGKLTLNELQGEHKPAMGHSDGTTHLDQRFYAADANHDGGLDRDEAKDMPMLTQYFDEVDANKDGQVTRREYFDAMPLLHGAKKNDTNAKPEAM